MPAVPSVNHVFLYGSLRPGSSNPHAAFLPFRCPSLGCAKLKGRLFRCGSQFVAVHEPGGRHEVTGEVLALPHPHGDRMLESLDRYEGIGKGLPAPPLLRREKVTAVLISGHALECWTWLFTLPFTGLMEIPGGDALA